MLRMLACLRESTMYEWILETCHEVFWNVSNVISVRVRVRIESVYNPTESGPNETLAAKGTEKWAIAISNLNFRAIWYTLTHTKFENRGIKMVSMNEKREVPN